MNYSLIDHNTYKCSQKYLHSIYLLTNGVTEKAYGCVPNGEIGISIILQGESHIKQNDGWIKQPEVSIYGLLKQVQFHKMSPHYIEINLGFNPHYLQLFMRASMSSLLQRNATNLYDLFPKDRTDLLYEDLIKYKTNEDIQWAAERFLMASLLNEKVDERIAGAFDLIVQNKISQVDALSHQLNISSTGLRNLFREQVGISPKDLMKIQRIKSALHFKFTKEGSLTDLAYQLGYYDQSHFIHDFKEAIGLTPKQYFSNDQLTFDFYNFGRWNYDSFAAQ
jgi:AraC-like DNA-binding protein